MEPEGSLPYSQVPATRPANNNFSSDLGKEILPQEWGNLALLRE
jgi:hypothetical protein